MENIIKAFSDLQDPRKHKPRKYPFINIVVMAVSAVASGATSWYEIQYFCKAHEDWFASFPDVASGIPSHDTGFSQSLTQQPLKDASANGLTSP